MPNYEVLTSKMTFWGDSGVCISLSVLMPSLRGGRRRFHHPILSSFQIVSKRNGTLQKQRTFQLKLIYTNKSSQRSGTTLTTYYSGAGGF